MATASSLYLLRLVAAFTILAAAGLPLLLPLQSLVFHLLWFPSVLIATMVLFAKIEALMLQRFTPIDSTIVPQPAGAERSSMQRRNKRFHLRIRHVIAMQKYPLAHQ